MGLAGWAPLPEGGEPFNDWVIMRMTVAALALPDVTMCRGTYPVPVARPYISGQEGVGVVVDAAPGRRDLIGRRVAAVTIQPFGSLAPVSVGISTIFEVPDGMTDEDAGGFLIPAHTAYHAAIRRGASRAGETVVVLGAAGGLGSAIVQLCVAQGARVIAVVGGDGQGGVLPGARRGRHRPFGGRLRDRRPRVDGRTRRRRDRRPGAGRDGRAGARAARSRRSPCAVRPRRWSRPARSALLHVQPHARRRDARELSASGDAAHPRRDAIGAARAARGRSLPPDGDPVRCVRRRCRPRSPTWPSGARRDASSCAIAD